MTTRRLAILATSLLGWAAAALAQPTDLTTYTLFGTFEAQVGTDGTVTNGNVGSSADVRVSSRASLTGASDVAGNSVKLNSGAFVPGDVFYNTLSSRAALMGQGHSPIAIPFVTLPPPPTVLTPVQGSIDIGRGSSVTLFNSPCRWQAVSAGADSTIHLAASQCDMQELVVRGVHLEPRGRVHDRRQLHRLPALPGRAPGPLLYRQQPDRPAQRPARDRHLRRPEPRLRREPVHHLHRHPRRERQLRDRRLRGRHALVRRRLRRRHGPAGPPPRPDRVLHRREEDERELRHLPHRRPPGRRVLRGRRLAAAPAARALGAGHARHAAAPPGPTRPRPGRLHRHRRARRARRPHLPAVHGARRQLLLLPRPRGDLHPDHQQREPAEHGLRQGRDLLPEPEPEPRRLLLDRRAARGRGDGRRAPRRVGLRPARVRDLSPRADVHPRPVPGLQRGHAELDPVAPHARGEHARPPPAPQRMPGRQPPDGRRRQRRLRRAGPARHLGHVPAPHERVGRLRCRRSRAHLQRELRPGRGGVLHPAREPAQPERHAGPGAAPGGQHQGCRCGPS